MRTSESTDNTENIRKLNEKYKRLEQEEIGKYEKLIMASLLRTEEVMGRKTDGYVATETRVAHDNAILFDLPAIYSYEKSRRAVDISFLRVEKEFEIIFKSYLSQKYCI